jgi:transcriptional antiterminator NusG
MIDNNVKKWYVVRAVSGQENKVKNYIETEINRLGMGDYISQVLVPTEKVVTVRDGKKSAKTVFIFLVTL